MDWYSIIMQTFIRGRCGNIMRIEQSELREYEQCC